MRNGEKGVMKIMSSSNLYLVYISWGLPKWLSGKESTCNAGDMGFILGREDLLEKQMATHSSILAWEVPQTEEPNGLQSMGLQRVRHNLGTK